MKPIKALIATTWRLGAASGALGCRKDKGPLEKAGRKLDKTVDDAKEKLDTKR